MRTFLAIATALALFAVRAADFSTPKAVRLEWDYPTNEFSPSLVFFVHSTSDASRPVESWPVVAVVNTNSAPVFLALPLALFAVRGSNEWGLGDFSDVLTSAPPRRDVRLKIRP